MPLLKNVSREKAGISGALLLVASIAAFVGGLVASVDWLAIAGGALMIVSLIVVTVMGTPSAVLAIRKEREANPLAKQIDKKLQIEPETFESRVHMLVKIPIWCIPVAMIAGCIYGLIAAPKEPATMMILLGFLLTGLGMGALFLHALGEKIIADSDGLKAVSPVRTKQILWKDAADLKSVYYSRFGMQYHLYSMDTALPFSGNLHNAPRLVAIINAALSNQPDKRGNVAVGHLPAPASYSSNVAGGLLAFGIIALLVGAVVSSLAIEEAHRLFAVPTVALNKVPDFAGTGKEIRIEGALFAADDQPAEARDAKHKFALQQVEIEDHSGKHSYTLYTGWFPNYLWIKDGGNTVLVKSNELYRSHLPSSTHDRFDADWKSTPAGQLVSTIFDKSFTEYEKRTGSMSMEVWNFPEGIPVSVIGKVIKGDGKVGNPGEIVLTSSDKDILWISTQPQKQMMNDWLIVAVGGSLTLLYGLACLIAAWLEYAKSKVKGPRKF